MDIVGRKGGRCRPPRQPLPPEQEQRVRAATEAVLEAGSSAEADALHVGCSTRSTRTPRACRPGSSPEASGALPGTTMSERRQWFLENSDEIRTLLMYEPRGHASMSGAILQPPTRPDADWGVLYIEVSGCLPMCGHGTIGVATVLVETGMVEVTEPVTTIRLDTPAGLVTAEVAVEGRRRA